MSKPSVAYWAPRAWIGGRWQERVRLVAAHGVWDTVRSGVEAEPEDAVLTGPVLPPLVDAHSHAFQRAFAGLAERRDAEHDDFWSWRDRMYGVAGRIEPDALRAIAAQLGVELLHGGYTHVCEFHYLQHRPDGRPYDDPATLAWALADAADDARIGLTLLPVLYERAGFDAPALRPDQRRFAADARAVLALRRQIEPRVRCGLAIHSLRAARPESIAQLVAQAGDGPIHVHAAEQQAEVRDCVAATGLAPLAWLARHGGLDARWQLVHATHATPDEIDAVARSGAGVVLCPTTEANLGDGVPDLPRWLAHGVPLAIGSDSQVSRDAFEELRWLELGQRLALQRRNVAAEPARQPSSAARLFDAAADGGARAAGLARWGLVQGARADLLEADPRADVLRGLPADATLDALVFAGAQRPWRTVVVGGQPVIERGVHRDAAAIGARFEQAMQSLWSAR